MRWFPRALSTVVVLSLLMSFVPPFRGSPNLSGAAEVAYANGDTHTHFRYGHLTWKPVGGTTIEFTLQNAWRRNGYVCRDVTSPTLATKPCSGPSGLPGVGDIILETIGSTRLDPGDGSPPIGSPAGPLLYLVTSIDPANNWLFGLALDPKSLPSIDTTISHTYAAPGNYTARIDSCCRISGLALPNAHINNPDGTYRVETRVNVTTGNRSPVSTLPPIVSCPQNAVCAFQVPAADPDGDQIRFRLSTAAEASSGSFVQPGPPHASHAASISSTGIYTWNTTGATLGPSGTNTLYSTQVTIEDLDAAGNVKSKVALDFFIWLVPKVGDPPVFNNPPTAPACGSSVTATVGQTVSFTVSSSDPDPGQTVTLNVVGLPLGATMTPPLPISGNPVSSTFSWRPTAAQVGTHVVTFTATDNSAGLAGQQGLCSITVVAATGADLLLTKSDDPDPVTVGQQLTYTLTVKNTGPAPATGVTLTDTLPSDVTIISTRPSEKCRQLDGIRVECTLGTLAKDASTTVLIVVKPRIPGTITNTASVKANEPDPNPNNNTSTQTTVVHPALVVVLHGLGQNADEIARTRAELGDPDKPLYRQMAEALINEFGEISVFRYVEDRAGGGDSQSSVRDNAIALAGFIKDLRSRVPNKKVVLVGYSMGAAIIRGYLALYPDAEEHVAAAIFLEGAHQGSWLLKLHEGVSYLIIANDILKLSGVPIEPRAAAVVHTLIFVLRTIDFVAFKFVNINPNRPAARDLTPQSEWYFSVNAPITKAINETVNVDPVPNQASYYNFYGDINFQWVANVWGYELPLTPRISLGDLVLLPGEDDPTATPFLGGARFATSVDAGQRSEQWALTSNVQVNFASLKDCLPGGKPCTEALKDLITSPPTHWQVHENMNVIRVHDRVGGQGSIVLAQEIVEIVRAHAK